MKKTHGFDKHRVYTQNEVYMKYKELQKEINNRISYYEAQQPQTELVRRELLKLKLLKKQSDKNFYSKIS